MNYPRSNNYLEFCNNGNGTYAVRDFITERESVLPAQIVGILQRMDGNHSVRACARCSKEEAGLIEEFLYEENLIRDTRVSLRTFGTLLYALWMAPAGKQKSARTASLLYYRFVTFLWLPVFAKGLLLLYTGQAQIYDYGLAELAIGIVAGLVIGVVMHELAHAAAAFHYGIPVYEMGFGVLLFLPVGYTLMGERKGLPRISKAQINLAGIKANALIAGTALILTRHFRFSIAAGVIYTIAIQNLILMAINILPYGMNDGYLVLCSLLGFPEEWRCWEKRAFMSSRTRYGGVKGVNRTMHSAANLILAAFSVEGILVISVEVLSIFAWLM